eukprot:114431-Alexandrium_andersonii.AAC.1
MHCPPQHLHQRHAHSNPYAAHSITTRWFALEQGPALCSTRPDSCPPFSSGAQHGVCAASPVLHLFTLWH